jgi:hypothetical protein
MSDMAPRPRGGWQVGNRLFRQQAALEARVKDLAPDVYGVTRVAGGFVVRHYSTSMAKQPCCEVAITPRPGESDVDALARASMQCDRRHLRPGIVEEWSDDDDRDRV